MTPVATAVTLHLARVAPRTPPFVDLLLDVRLANGEDAPRWFLLPSYLDPGGGLGPLRASSVEIYTPAERTPRAGELRYARLIGSAGFQVARLPPGAELRLRGLALSCWEAPPALETLVVPVGLASRLTFGDEDLERWLPLALVAPQRCEAVHDAGAVVASKDTPGGVERPLEALGARWLSVRVEPTPGVRTGR